MVGWHSSYYTKTVLPYTEMVKYIVAVSGGVDSVVLLDVMSKVPSADIIVAHFDHGIRPESHDDALFVERLAVGYGFPFEGRREELGPKAGEALARERRYAFLQNLAAKHGARIVTAHHLDDVVETVAINLTRGTGWRGVAALHSEVIRPLIDTPKSTLVAYARRKGLEWREDSTNATDAYLRNRIRAQARDLPLDSKRQLRALHAEQRALRRQLEREAHQLVGEGPQYSRYLLSHMGDKAATECLWVIFGGALTRPQLARALRAVKTAKPGTAYQAGAGRTMQFTTRHFTV